MMKYLSLAVLLIVLDNSNLARAQSATSDNEEALTSRCPVIRWVEDSDPWDWKSPIRFEVRVEGADPEAKLRYTWVVCPGQILSGQNTNSIMAVPSDKTQSFTAIVVICGLPDECQNVTSVSKVKPLQTADQPDSH